jgi:broad specificity phosphatase PhoE
MSTQLYLTRHGETEWNVVHRMQGFKDSPLTELGVRQAECLRTVMDTVAIDIMYSSPSPRAMRTAEIIRGGRTIPLETSEALKEMGFGIWEGRVHAEVQAHYPEQWIHFWHDPEMFSIKDSETYAQVQNRAIHFTQEVLQKHPGKSVLIVTHTIIIKIIMAYFESSDIKQLWKSPEIHPTSLSRIDILDHTPKVVLHGDTSHYQYL